MTRHANDAATHGQFRLELAEPGFDHAPDGSITARLALHNGRTGESMEQAVALVAAGQDPQRARAYVAAWTRSLSSLLACVVDRMGDFVTPDMLAFPHLALEQTPARTTEEFLERLADPRTLREWAAAADAANAARWLRDTCESLGLGDHADALVALCRTGIDLTSHPAAAGRTHLGGIPDLPPGAAWPHHLDHPMTLLAQLDLTELSRCDDDRLLPPAGLLQIFADLAWDDPAPGPSVLVTVQPLGELIATAAPDGAETLPTRAVVPSVNVSLPPLDSPFYRDLTGLELADCDPTDPGAEFAAFIEFLNEFHPPLDDHDRPRHRLLGYADPLQDDPWQHCATAEPGVPPTRWQLLAQIDSEPDAPLGDNGLIYVFIPSDALAAGDFTRAIGVWQMY